MNQRLIRIIESETGRADASPGFSIPALTGAITSGPEDIVLLHGFFSAPWSVQPMALALQTDGISSYCPRYASWARDFDTIVDRMAAELALRGIGGPDRPVHFVGHSMGGLVARAVVERLAPRRMGRMVMIGTPNAGSELADFCVRSRILRPVLGRAASALVTRRVLPALDSLSVPDYPIGVIAGDRPFPNPILSPLRLLPIPHDGKVSVASTHLDGEADHITLPVSHTIMPFNRAVQKQTAHFLRTGRFWR